MNPTRTASTEKASRPKAKVKAASDRAKPFFQHNLDLDNFAAWLRDHTAERRMRRILSAAIRKTTKLRFLEKEI
jgi:hypothetical protein